EYNRQGSGNCVFQCNLPFSSLVMARHYYYSDLLQNLRIFATGVKRDLPPYRTVCINECNNIGGIMSEASRGYRWGIVAAGGLIGCMAMGAMFSLPVFLLPISQDTGWSVTGVSSAMTFGFLAMAAGNLGWGTLSDRIGPRPVVM